jgi:NO-binding membrane sensor protein with MHYT domain
MANQREIRCRYDTGRATVTSLICAVGSYTALTLLTDSNYTERWPGRKAGSVAKII